jgi:pimeloyl-ACP methyl ester carboxylesterase
MSVRGVKAKNARERAARNTLPQVNACFGSRGYVDTPGPDHSRAAFLDRMFDDLNWGTKRALLRLYLATPVEGCGHRPFVDEPELFARLLVDFLRRQLRPQAH